MHQPHLGGVDPSGIADVAGDVYFHVRWCSVACKEYFLGISRVSGFIPYPVVATGARGIALHEYDQVCDGAVRGVEEFYIGLARILYGEYLLCLCGAEKAKYA